MTQLAEKQFEILPHAEAQDGFVFGIGASVSLNDEGFDPGDNDWMTQTTDNARRGVRSFGRDVAAPKTWAWESHVDQEDVESAVAVLDDFSAAWSPETLALEPGEVTAVRYKLAGRDRRVFGRPRRFAAPPSNLIDSGFVPVTHDFELIDSRTYDDVESQVVLAPEQGAQGGGFTFPVTFPIQTMPTSESGAHQLVVSGRARAYPRIRFNGPWTNPFLETDDWSVRWWGGIPTGGWVEIDARPWNLTVLNQDGASAVKGLDRRVHLEDLWFAARSQPQIRLGGSPGTGATALIAWRNTWTSI